MTETPMRTCTGCKRVLPATTEFFYAAGAGSRAKYGVRPSCIDCCSAQTRAYALAHGDEVRARHRAWRSKNRETINARRRGNAAEIERSRAWREANRARHLAYQSAYAAAHLGDFRVRNRNRHARKKGNGGTHTREDIDRQYATQGGKCHWCGVAVGEKYHVDHVIPLSRGGTNGPENLVIACPPCNLSKRDKLPHELIPRIPTHREDHV